MNARNVINCWYAGYSPSTRASSFQQRIVFQQSTATDKNGSRTYRIPVRVHTFYNLQTKVDAYEYARDALYFRPQCPCAVVAILSRLLRDIYKANRYRLEKRIIHSTCSLFPVLLCVAFLARLFEGEDNILLYS